MNQYFFKVTSDYWMAHNRLQEEAKTVARKMDRILVTEKQLQNFIVGNLYMEIDKLNKKHCRCNPLKIEIATSYTHSDSEETYIIPNVFHLTRYLVKEAQ